MEGACAASGTDLHYGRGRGNIWFGCTGGRSGVERALSCQNDESSGIGIKRMCVTVGAGGFEGESLCVDQERKMAWPVHGGNAARRCRGAMVRRAEWEALGKHGVVSPSGPGISGLAHGIGVGRRVASWKYSHSHARHRLQARGEGVYAPAIRVEGGEIQRIDEMAVILEDARRCSAVPQERRCLQLAQQRRQSIFR